MNSSCNNFFIRDNKDWNIAIGKIDSIEGFFGISQTRAGNRIITIGYKIKKPIKSAFYRLYEVLFSTMMD